MRATHYLAQDAYGRVKGARCSLVKVGGVNVAIFADKPNRIDTFWVQDSDMALFKEEGSCWVGDVFRRLSDPSQTWVCVATDTDAHTVTLKLASKVGL